jgi:hypothetical protein
MQNEHLDEEEKEHLSISQEGIGQIEKFIKELLNFTRVSDLNPEQFSIVQIVEESLKMMRDSFLEKRIVLERSFAADLPPVVVDGDKIRQVFLNILRNAVEAVKEGGRIKRRSPASRRTASPGSRSGSLTTAAGSRKRTGKISSSLSTRPSRPGSGWGYPTPGRSWSSTGAPSKSPSQEGRGRSLKSAFPARWKNEIRADHR